MTHSPLIAGGGMVGLAMALALAKEGLASTVVEPSPASHQLARPFDGRSSALAYGSALWLESLCVWQSLAPHANPIRHIRVTDNDLNRGASPFFVHFDDKESGENPMGYIAENRWIRQALWQAARHNPLITLLEGNAVTTAKAEASHITATLSHGEDRTAPLIIVAEGINSSLRAQAGIRSQHHDYGQSAIVLTVSHEKPHQDTAQERFYPAGPFAILPMVAPADVTLPYPHASSIVWTEHRAYAERFTRLPPDDFLTELERRFGNFLGKIAAIPPIFTYPLTRMTAHSLVAPRLALIGDAAHRMHPIAGQGVNLGFRDVMALAPLLGKQVRLGLDLGDTTTLRHYHQERQLDTHSMLDATHYLNKLFATTTPEIRHLRRAGMALVQASPFIKKQMVRHAMGLNDL